MKRLLLSLAIPALACAAGSANAQSTAAATEATPVVRPPDAYTQEFAAARQLARAGRREDALRAFDTLLLAYPGDSDVLLARGQLHSWMKHWPEAEADLRAATAASAGNADAWTALGNTYLWSDRPGLAVQAYSRWIELRPDSAEARIARGRAHRSLGDTQAARADFEEAGKLGADTGEIGDDIDSLTPRRLNPDATYAKGFRWSASLSGSRSWFSPSRSAWTDANLSLRRHFARGSVALDLLSAHRFDRGDQAWALDAYTDLWPRAYANLRYQQAPSASLFPGHAWRAEVYQGVGKGWELSASIDQLRFDDTVNIYGVGIARYVGRFYLRARHLYIPSDNGHSSSDRLQVRYYYKGDADNYFEVAGGWGRSEDRLLGGVGTQGRKHSVSVGYVRFPTPRSGFRIGADMGSERGGFDDRGVSGALYLRW